MNKETIPYFYIIQHIPSGKFYGGSRWAKGCNPNEFMVEGGYTTSSDTINDLIKTGGLDSFRKILILTDFGYGITANDYETVFLQSNDIASNVNWLNKHNNDGFFSAAYGSKEHKAIMVQKYGAEHAMQSEVLRNKAKSTSLANCGYEYPMQSPEGMKAFTTAMFEKYGVNYAMELPEMVIKMKETNLERYGFKCSLQNEAVKAKRDVTWDIKYGGHPFSNEEIIAKGKATKYILYGDENYTNREKTDETCFKRYGVKFVTQLDSMKEKSEETQLERYGVTNISKTDKRRREIKEYSSGSTYWNDGVNEYKIPRDTLPKESWIRGSLPRRKRTEEENNKNSKQRLGSKLYNDGIRNHQVLLGEIPDPSWVLGKIKSTNPNVNNGAKFYNDGITQYHVKPGEIPEPHWVRGYIKRK